MADFLGGLFDHDITWFLAAGLICLTAELAWLITHT